MARLIVLVACFFQVQGHSVLQARLQEMLNNVASEAQKDFHHDVAMQIGWYSPTEQFTVVAGLKDKSDGSTQNVTPKDTFLYGSGTKPFTAAALMRLIDQGKLKATDLAHKHIDPFLQKNNGTSLVALFGPGISKATVLDLVRMTAGIPDFEVGTRDADILEAGNQDWPVYDNIWYASEYQKVYGGKCQTKDDCDCGQLPMLTGVTCEPRQQKCMKSGPYVGCFGKKNGYRLPDGWICWLGQRVGFCPTKQKAEPLVCAPGNCSFYSSASYEIAGLLIAAIGTPKGKYTDMDLGEFALPARDRYPSLSFPPVTSSARKDVGPMKISDHLTTQGRAQIFGGAETIIFDQNPTVLGWTCGHMVGAAGDVAKFFYDLLDPESPSPVVSNASRAEMTRTQPLSMGWGNSSIAYGAGLMSVSMSRNKSYQPDKPSQWGYYFGHGGLTYGFSSNQGYMAPARAGFSITSNTDLPTFSGLATCKAVEIAAEVLDGQQISLGCSAHMGPFLQNVRWNAMPPISVEHEQELII